jgi:hypothetical protein
MKCRSVFPRFGLKTVFIAVAVLSVCLAHFVIRARDIHFLRTHIRALGGAVTFTHEVDAYGNILPTARHPLPQVIRELIGDDFGVSPFAIECDSEQVAGHDLDFLKECRCAGEIKRISLSNTHVGDDAVDSLASARNLRWLEVANTIITNEGVRRMVRMQKLEFLDLTGTQIDDSAVDYFSQFQSLRFLIIGNTAFTSVGVTRLRELLPTCDVKTDYHFILE